MLRELGRVRQWEGESQRDEGEEGEREEVQIIGGLEEKGRRGGQTRRRRKGRRRIFHEDPVSLT